MQNCSDTGRWQNLHRSIRTLLILAFGAALLAMVWMGSGLAQQVPDSPSQLPQKIAELMANHTKLIARREPAGLAALFAPDAVYVAADGTAFVGQARIRGFYTQLFVSLNQSRDVVGDVTRQTRVEQVMPLGDGALAIGRGLNVANGTEPPTTTTDHWVAIFAKVGSDWKIRVFSVGEDAPRSPPPN